ncbi:hypothetical protein FALCPG4_010744 [Fusarium falciforme]
MSVLLGDSQRLLLSMGSPTPRHETKHGQKRGEKTRRERSGSGGYATLLQAKSTPQTDWSKTPGPVVCSRAARSKSFFLQVRASRFVIDEMKRWSLRRQD